MEVEDNLSKYFSIPNLYNPFTKYYLICPINCSSTTIYMSSLEKMSIHLRDVQTIYSSDIFVNKMLLILSYTGQILSCDFFLLKRIIKKNYDLISNGYDLTLIIFIYENIT